MVLNLIIHPAIFAAAFARIGYKMTAGAPYRRRLIHSATFRGNLGHVTVIDVFHKPHQIT